MRNFAIVTCLLALAACDHNDAQPAQSPSADTTPPAHSSDTADLTTGSVATTTTTMAGATGTPSHDAAPTRATTTNNNGGPAGHPAPDNSAPQTPAAPAAPAVVTNPGVADGTKNADNTKTNDRDRHGALTPMDQGNSASELKITADLRKSVMSDSSLSFTAKNVKIITVGTKVTLRGPVKTDAERSAIEARARQIAGVTDVDDQIEVKK